GEQLVYLLLILREGEARLGMGEDEGHLLGDAVLVERHRHAAQGLRRDHSPIEAGATVAADGELVAASATHHRDARRARRGPAPSPATSFQLQLCQMP